MCQSSYVIEMDKKLKELNITQVVDISNCREKAARYTGMAAAVLDKVSKQVCASQSRVAVSGVHTV